jgi:hypothetical protein
MHLVALHECSFAITQGDFSLKAGGHEQEDVNG